MNGPSNAVFRSFDLVSLGILPATWDTEIVRIASSYARSTVLDGASITSRESDKDTRIEVGVVPGDVISKELPWLFRLYEAELCDLASSTAGYRTYSSTDVVSAVNINVIEGLGGRYEWHVDSNPLTGLLFVNSLDPSDGGELLFRGDGVERLIAPRAGVFLAFDARELPHTVLPLKSAVRRISVPMNYYGSPSHQERPGDLNQYLYREGQA